MRPVIAGCLVIRKCFCEIRVHDCKSGAAEVIAVAAFDPSVFLGDDRGIAHLAAGGGNGQDLSLIHILRSMSDS